MAKPWPWRSTCCVGTSPAAPWGCLYVPYVLRLLLLSVQLALYQLFMVLLLWWASQ